MIRRESSYKSRQVRETACYGVRWVDVVSLRKILGAE